MEQTIGLIVILVPEFNRQFVVAIHLVLHRLKAAVARYHYLSLALKVEVIGFTLAGHRYFHCHIAAQHIGAFHFFEKLIVEHQRISLCSLLCSTQRDAIR